MPEFVLSEVVDRIATVTLNRPAARNALSREMLDALVTRLSDSDPSDEVDVIVLTGAGPAFCADSTSRRWRQPDCSSDQGTGDPGRT